MKRVLLVMDMQEIAFGRQHASYFRYDAGLMQKVNAVIAEYNSEDVIYIRTLMRQNFLSRFAPVKVFEGMAEAALAADLRRVSDRCFTKYRGDAFTDAAFAAYIQACGADAVEIVGIDGGGCVALTAMSACKKGLHTTIRTEAVGTMFPKKQEKYFQKLKQLGAEIL